MTKKLVEVNDLSIDQCSVSKNIRFKTSMLRSDLYGFGDACIVIKGRMHVWATGNTNINQKDSAFKNSAPFISYIINSTLIDKAEDLDIVMPMYHLLDYSQNYFMASGS